MRIWLLLLILMSGDALAVGIGVSPTSLHFERKNEQKAITLFHLGEGEGVYEVEGDGFESEPESIRIAGNDRARILVKLTGDEESGEIVLRQKPDQDGLAVTPAVIVGFSSSAPKKKTGSASTYFKEEKPKGFFIGFSVFILGLVIYSVLRKRWSSGSDTPDM